jgi:hypothetical protein
MLRGDPPPGTHQVPALSDALLALRAESKGEPGLADLHRCRGGEARQPCLAANRDGATAASVTGR